MKKVAVLSAVGVLALAGSAFAQGEATAAATLEMRIVPVDVTNAAARNLSYQGDTEHNTVGFGDTDRTRRFEVQYRIIDPTEVVASLCAMQFNITASTSGGTLSDLQVGRALLTSRQAAAGSSAAPVTDPDNSGVPAGAFASAAGLHRAFRGGIPAPAPNNDDPANGTLVPGGINLITPLTLTQLDQFSDAGWYGLYSFEVTVGEAQGGNVTVNLTAAAVADPTTHNRWGGFEDGDPVPRTSQNAIDGTASFVVEIPAPGSLALVGLGGLIAARRRRA